MQSIAQQLFAISAVFSVFSFHVNASMEEADCCIFSLCGGRSSGIWWQQKGSFLLTLWRSDCCIKMWQAKRGPWAPSWMAAVLEDDSRQCLNTGEHWQDLDTGLGISQEHVHAVIQKELQISNIWAHWVPKIIPTNGSSFGIPCLGTVSPILRWILRDFWDAKGTTVGLPGKGSHDYRSQPCWSLETAMGSLTRTTLQPTSPHWLLLPCRNADLNLFNTHKILSWLLQADTSSPGCRTRWMMLVFY